ncbi:MAG: rRNA pseudouridine synthase [Firmicutes bacterium]|nr:rRNA pseudouridine synthase [Bacillota bacterium]
MSTRLNKYIASAGLCSRRKADELISNGNVKVNGAVVNEMGFVVEDGDRVTVNGRLIEGEKPKVYVVLNKPLGYITSMDDDKNRATVADLVSDIPERLFPVGRLDYNTTGLLIMTNDGELTYSLTHPKHEVDKTYIATVSGVLSGKRLAQLRKGVDIGGFVTSPARVRVLRQNPRSAVVEITIHEGKNRQVRKMFAAGGNQVQSLERVAIGELKLGRLKEGHYRKLTRQEIEYLKGL